MNALMMISIFISIAGLIIVLLPFFQGPGGRLENASYLDSVDVLEKRQNAIVERWKVEHKNHMEGFLSAREWRLRKTYLTNRYVDVARRIDWMNRQSEISGLEEPKPPTSPSTSPSTSTTTSSGSSQHSKNRGHS
ncbi:MAG: hypothetical protein NT027_04095 [Proteobacteria bacterium]|nr:hypothetical protein [Pseudomonadota bacterium]